MVIKRTVIFLSACALTSMTVSVFCEQAISNPEVTRRPLLVPLTKDGRPLKPKWTLRMGIKFINGSNTIGSIEPNSFAHVITLNGSLNPATLSESSYLQKNNKIVELNESKITSAQDFERVAVNNAATEIKPWKINTFYFWVWL